MKNNLGLCMNRFESKLIFFIATYLSSSLSAEPLIQKKDKVEWDWGQMRVRYSGSYIPEPGIQNLSYEESVNRAIEEGVNSGRPAIVKAHKEELSRQGLASELVERSANRIGNEIGPSILRYQTYYYRNGAVKVTLENSLASILNRKEGNVPMKSPDSKKIKSRFTGIILRLDKIVKPVAKYEIVDSSGGILFSMESMTKDAYEDHLMGRWFINPPREELTGFVGPKYLSLHAKVISGDRFLVVKKVWLDALQDSPGILTEAKIALVVPN